MPKALDVPWDKIRESCEKGTSQREVAKLFGISEAAVRMRSNRENWNTPKRVQNRLNKVAGLHNSRVAQNQSLIDQLNEAKAPQNSVATSTDLDEIAKQYRHKSADKLFKILSQTVIAPPRTWKDFDIADKMMRRVLGLDDGEAKHNTIVQLQVVNDRLRANVQDDIIEGECVTDASPSEDVQELESGSQPVNDSEPAPDTLQ
jgi:predicted transcriptional regulator